MTWSDGIRDWWIIDIYISQHDIPEVFNRLMGLFICLLREMYLFDEWFWIICLTHPLFDHQHLTMQISDNSYYRALLTSTNKSSTTDNSSYQQLKPSTTQIINNSIHQQLKPSQLKPSTTQTINNSKINHTIKSLKLSTDWNHEPSIRLCLKWGGKLNVSKRDKKVREILWQQKNTVFV